MKRTAPRLLSKLKQAGNVYIALRHILYHTYNRTHLCTGLACVDSHPYYSPPPPLL